MGFDNMPTTTYVPLGTITLASAASEVVFASIPASLNGQSFRDLVLVANAKSTRTAFDQDGLFVRLNNDSSNGSRVTMLGRGSNETLSDTASSITSPLGGNAANTMPIIIQVMDYTQTDKQKAVLIRANSNAPSVSSVVAAVAGRWASTAAVTSITLVTESGSTFASGSVFSMFGIAG